LAENAAHDELGGWENSACRPMVQENATLDQRLTEKAQRLRKEAQGTPSGVIRDELIRQAQQAETASHMLEWLSVPSLQPPR
jgi:hypothetical protein